MSFITTNKGTRIFYKDWGTGKPVVFTHPWAMSSDFWGYILVYLQAQGIRCIALDRRGHGRSDDPGQGYDFDTLADDLEEFMEKLDLRDVTLVGYSSGGGEALRYQTRYGHLGRVSRLVLIGAPDCLVRTADNPDGVEAAIVNGVLDDIFTDFPQWLEDGVDAFYLPGKYGVSQGIIHWTIDMMLQTPMLAAMECQRNTLFTDFREDIRKVSIPTLVIHGNADASIPFRCGEAIARTIPGCQFRVYQDAPHGLIITHAEQIKADLLTFIGGGQG